MKKDIDLDLFVKWQLQQGYRKNPSKTCKNVSDFTSHQLSAIIGMWRMGNPDTVIASVLNIDVKIVSREIKIYKNIINES